MDTDNKIIDQISKETYDNKSNFSKHEAICQYRYETLIINMNNMTTTIKEIKQEITNLNNIAISSKVSLKTLLIVGSIVATITTIFIAVLNYIK